MTAEGKLSRDIVFQPDELIARLRNVWELGLYRGTKSQYFRGIQELSEALKPDEIDYSAIARKKIKQELRRDGRKILSDKNTCMEFCVENPKDLLFSEQNLRDAFVGRAKATYRQIEKDGDVYFEPLKPVKNVDLVSVVPELHRIRITVFPDRKKIVSSLDQQTDLIFTRVVDFLNGSIRPEMIQTSKIGEINMENLYFLGYVDNFRFTTNNFKRLNKTWAERAGYLYINPNTPGVRAANRVIKFRHGLVPAGRTILESAQVKFDNRIWTIVAVQNPGLLPLRPTSITNFFIVPSPSIAESTGI